MRLTEGNPQVSRGAQQGNGAGLASVLNRPGASRLVQATARLRYVCDEQPGIRRLRTAQGFRYLLPSGAPLRDRVTLERIVKLAIPPAYEDVWICPRADGHLQATGRDARGRKQYRYHVQWRELRDDVKFERLSSIGQRLPALRRAVRADIADSVMSRETVLATIVRLLDKTFVRIGNESYAQENGSHGLTTLRNRHVHVSGARVRFSFRGKSGVAHQLEITDARVAAIVRRCRELPGQELFQYRAANGHWSVVESTDVNAYLRERSGIALTAKDFRTWHASVHALDRLMRLDTIGTTEAARKRALNAALSEVSARLRNTVAVCRKSYVHPAVLDAFMDPDLAEAVRGLSLPRTRGALSSGEQRMLRFLAMLKKKNFEVPRAAQAPKDRDRRQQRGSPAHFSDVRGRLTRAAQPLQRELRGEP